MRLKIGYTHKMDVLWAWLILKDKPLDFGVSPSVFRQGMQHTEYLMQVPQTTKRKFYTAVGHKP